MTYDELSAAIKTELGFGVGVPGAHHAEIMDLIMLYLQDFGLRAFTEGLKQSNGGAA